MLSSQNFRFVLISGIVLVAFFNLTLPVRVRAADLSRPKSTCLRLVKKNQSAALQAAQSRFETTTHRLRQRLRDQLRSAATEPNRQQARDQYLVDLALADTTLRTAKDQIAQTSATAATHCK